MGKETRQTLLALIAAILVFLVLFFALEWQVIMSVLVSVGIYFAVYYLTSPILKIGDIELESIKNGEEIKALYDQSTAEVRQMEGSIDVLEQSSVKEQAIELGGTSWDILKYLEGHPSDISQSRHFLTYYFPTANKIIKNYIRLKVANISSHKLVEVQEKTTESLDLLNDLFAKQRDSYHKDILLDLEVESELLENTLKLGGGEINEK